jgi:hypothetical protein
MPTTVLASNACSMQRCPPCGSGSTPSPAPSCLLTACDATATPRRVASALATCGSSPTGSRSRRCSGVTAASMTAAHSLIAASRIKVGASAPAITRSCGAASLFVPSALGDVRPTPRDDGSIGTSPEPRQGRQPPENLELWTSHQPKGARVADMLEWCRWFIDQYSNDPEWTALPGGSLFKKGAEPAASQDGRSA